MKRIKLGHGTGTGPKLGGNVPGFTRLQPHQIKKPHNSGIKVTTTVLT